MNIEYKEIASIAYTNDIYLFTKLARPALRA